MAAGEAFSRDQNVRLEAAVSAASRQTGMRFAVYVGSVDGDLMAFATRELTALTPAGEQVAMVAVDPGARRLEILTSATARRRLSDQACSLATLSMTSSFGLGDLVGGLTVGLRMLADATDPEHDDAGRPPSTSSTATPSEL